MDPRLSTVDLPNSTAEHFVHLVRYLLTASECAKIIQDNEDSLISTSGAHSNRLRHMYFDHDLVELLWNRLEPFYGTDKVVDEDGQTWIASRLNPFLRFCKYNAGDVFGPHVDGRRMMSVDHQSFMTVNIYLSTVLAPNGGATRVLGNVEGGKYKVVGLMQPEEGMAAVFRDSLFHDGEELKEGVKYLLRTDVIYQRETAFNFDGLYGGLSVEERALKALQMAEKLEDGGGNRDEAIVWYRKAFKLNPALESRGG